MTAPLTASCPACGSAAPRPAYACASVPVHSCLLVADQDSALAFPRGDLDIAFCPDCGFLFNRAFDLARNAYSPDYEETQAFSPLFREFIAGLSARWVDRYGLAGKTIVEIGCGKGEFLTEMIRAGAGRGVGVDPGVRPERIPGDVRDRTTWVRGFFPGDYPVLDADAVVCRHTLEHIAPVGDWLRAVRAAIGERAPVVLFELPDVLRVLEEGAFWDVYYEHCSYFSAGSLIRLFRSAGFEVLDTWRAYDDQYLILEARPARPAWPVPLAAPAGPPLALEDDLAALGAAVRRFSAAAETAVSHWRRRVREVADAGGRCVIWGSGSKGVAFLAALGADAAAVAAAVDINPFKHGRHMAGTGHRIVAPKELLDIKPDLVVAMNAAYVDEIGRDLRELGVLAALEAV
jgi:SAM-dependent methyltransferase